MYVGVPTCIGKQFLPVHAGGLKIFPSDPWQFFRT
jgi:hypothetical protein